jgi:diguanylate cyclase (GGDEF)-like protein
MLTSTVLALLLAAFLWRKRKQPGARCLSFLMLAVAFWGFGNGMEAAAPTIAEKLFWSKISYIGVTSSPPLFLSFAIIYSLHYKFFSTRNIILIWIIPVLTLGLAATNEIHHLIWTELTPSPIAGSNMYIYHHGVMFWVAIICIYLLMIVASLLLISAAIHFRKIYSRQAIALLVGVPLPCVANILYVIGYPPLLGYDCTPLAFALTGVLLIWGIYRYRLFDLAPVATETILEYMDDGVLVLDPIGRIVEMNPAFQKLFADQAGIKMGDRGDTFLTKWISPSFLQKTEGITEFYLKPQARYIDLHIVSILYRNRDLVGKMLIFRDITENKIAEQKIQNANEQLQLQLAENLRLESQLREQVVRDPLTGLFNRRYLDETLPRELARAVRDIEMIGVVMIDVDHFKQINDRLGHPAGDLILQQLSECINQVIRAGDFASRLGGDEFIIVMLGASADLAGQRAEEIRRTFAAQPLDWNNQRIEATISAGVVGFPAHGACSEDLLVAVDQVLYQAKESGRNCVVIKP